MRSLSTFRKKLCNILELSDKISTGDGGFQNVTFLPLSNRTMLNVVVVVVVQILGTENLHLKMELVLTDE